MRPSALIWPLVAAATLAGCGGGEEGGGEKVGAGDAAAAPGGQGDVDVRTIAQGPQGPLRTGEVVARTRAEWETAWRDHEGPGVPPAVDGVDFTRSMVVGMFAGQRPTGGFRVVPGKVERGDGAYSVGYEVVSPGRGCMTSQSLTSPFLVMSIPKAEQVSFSSNERSEDCQ